MAVVGAFGTFRFGLVWSIFFSGDTALLGEETVEDGPSSAATFSHVVASHDELHGEVWHIDVLVSIFEFHPAFNSLDKTVSVA